MDLCADLMASHMELNDRGWSRKDRLALMKQKLIQPPPQTVSRHGSIDSINPLNAHKITSATKTKFKNVEVEMSSSRDDKHIKAGVSTDSDEIAAKEEGLFFLICWFIVALGMMVSLIFIT